MSVACPLKYHGGKAYMAKKIISLFPPKCKNPNKPEPDDPGYLHFVEAYFGGGSVLLANNPEGISEVANDLNGDLTNFWRVLQGQTSFTQFIRLVEAIPFSEVEYKEARENYILEADGYGETIHRAVTFFIQCRQSLAGRMNSFTGITKTRTRRGMNNEVSAWLSAIEGLPEVHRRLKRVLILNRPALEVIESQDGPRSLFFLDPPYVHASRVTGGEYGDFEMDDSEHEKLLECLSCIKGRFLLSGYHSYLYDDFAKRYGWRCMEFLIDNKASSQKIKPIKTECVWLNYG